MIRLEVVGFRKGAIGGISLENHGTGWMEGGTLCV